MFVEFVFSSLLFLKSAAGSSGSLGAQHSKRGEALGGRKRKSSSTFSLCDGGHAFLTWPCNNEAVLGRGDVWFQQGTAQPRTAKEVRKAQVNF